MPENLEVNILQIDVEDRKREIAHSFWEEEGRPEGKAEEHWERACLIVMSEDAEPIEDPVWLRKQAEPEISASVEFEDRTDAPLENSMQTLRRRIAGKSAA